jgi:hypothetical protein
MNQQTFSFSSDYDVISEGECPEPVISPAGAIAEEH